MNSLSSGSINSVVEINLLKCLRHKNFLSQKTRLKGLKYQFPISIFILALIYSTLLKMLHVFYPDYLFYFNFYPYSHEHTSFVILSLSHLNKGFIHVFHLLIIYGRTWLTFR